jgi:hypothetical protein
MKTERIIKGNERKYINKSERKERQQREIKKGTRESNTVYRTPMKQAQTASECRAHRRRSERCWSVRRTIMPLVSTCHIQYFYNLKQVVSY